MIYEPIPPKRCCKCHQYFPGTLEYFYKQKDAKTGLQARCRDCTKALTKARAAANPEKEKERLRKWAVDHREQETQRARAYYAEHPEKRRQSAKKWRDANREEANRRIKKCEDAKQEQYKERRRKHREANPVRYRVRVLRRRARRRALPDTFTPTEWQASINYWQGKCAYCGSLPGFFPGMELTADHFIPLNEPTCPGTVWTNMIPACGSCNKSKQHRPAEQWLTKRYGERKAKAILRKIAAFFEWVASENHS